MHINENVALELDINQMLLQVFTRVTRVIIYTTYVNIYIYMYSIVVLHFIYGLNDKANGLFPDVCQITVRSCKHS